MLITREQSGGLQFGKTGASAGKVATLSSVDVGMIVEGSWVLCTVPIGPNVGGLSVTFAVWTGGESETPSSFAGVGGREPNGGCTSVVFAVSGGIFETPLSFPVSRNSKDDMSSSQGLFTDVSLSSALLWFNSKILIMTIQTFSVLQGNKRKT